MIDITSLMALIALLWTGYQQYALNKVCEKCPFRVEYRIEKEKKLSVSS